MMFSCFGFFNFYCYVGAYSTVYFRAVYFRASLQQMKTCVEVGSQLHFDLISKSPFALQDNIILFK